MMIPSSRSPMTDATRQLRALFDRAIELPPAERESFVARQCGTDTNLRERLLAMLRAVDDEQFLVAPTRSDALRTAGPIAAADEGVGAQIGPYRLLQQIGEGGFGLVFLAQQDAPVERQVALKIVKVGMDTRQVVARFEQERQALALMDHPHIARVLDAGATAAGRPYFVMDLVRGRPLAEYCDQERLSIADRLALFVQVCDAVQHAHGKGVIHRDLKPSNVLVTTQDHRPVAKVIDFGVAKATSQRLTDKTLFTEQWQVIGTLRYMSPEQAEGSLDIDVRTDVYALGVLLYELLTGSTPFVDSDSSVGLGELQRRIRELEAPRPSRRVEQAAEHLDAVAARRRCEPRQLVAALRGDLDWIVTKAIEKVRTQRYETANALALDVRAYLAGQTIVAAPPSATYRLRKFVRRNRGLVAAGTGIVLALVLGVLGTTKAMFEAISERERADLATAAEVQAKQAAEAHAREALAQAELAKQAEAKEVQARERAETIRDFMIAALQTSDAVLGGREDMTVLEAMQKAGADLDADRFRDDPETAAALDASIASILRNHGKFAASLARARHGLALLQQLHPGDHASVASALNDVASAHQQLHHLDEAEHFGRLALGMYDRLHPGDDQHNASMRNNLGATLLGLGRNEEAERLLLEATAMQRRLQRGEGSVMASMIDNLGKAEAALGKMAAAGEHFAEALAMRRRIFTGDHPALATGIGNLAVFGAQLGDNEVAERLLTEALAMQQRLHRGDHPTLVEALSNLAFLRSRLGRPTEAVPLLEQAIAMGNRLFDGAHPLVAHCQYTLASTNLALGDAAAAKQVAERSLAMHQELFRGDHLGTAMSLFVLARAEAALGNAAAARLRFDETLAMERRVPEAVGVLRETLWLSSCARGAAGDLVGALPELEEVVALGVRELDPDSPRLQEYREALQRCREALQKQGK